MNDDRKNINALLDRVAKHIGKPGGNLPTLKTFGQDIGSDEKQTWVWLKKRSSIPNGEATLRMLAWVEARE